MKANRFFLIVLFFFGAFFATNRAHAQTLIDVILHQVSAEPIKDELAYHVDMFVSVLDGSGNPIKEIDSENFSVSEDAQVVKVDTVVPVSDEPISVILVLDSSGSMGGLGINSAKEASRALIEGLNEGDQVAIIHFNETIETILNFTTEKEETLEQLELVDAVPESETCLYDAMYQATQLASQAPVGRRAIIVLTDGIDNCSALNSDDVIENAVGGIELIPIYTIGLGPSNKVEGEELQRISLKTGGHFLSTPRPEQLKESFLLLLDQLKSQYKISYKSFSSPGPHELLVKVSQDAVEVYDAKRVNFPEFPLIVTIATFANGEEVSGKQQLEISVEGGGAEVAKAELYVNGNLIAEDDVPPYSWELDFGDYEPGELNIEVRVIDANGGIIDDDSLNLLALAPTPSPTITPTIAPTEAAPAPITAKTLLEPPYVYIWILALLMAIIIGIISLVRRQSSSTESSTATPINDSFAHAAGQAFYQDPLALLRIVHSDDESLIDQEFRLAKNLLKIGRGAENDVIFTDNPISREHAIIEYLGNKFYLTDLNSTYGTFVNNKNLKKDPVEIKDGDDLQFGNRARCKFVVLVKEVDLSKVDDRTFDDLVILDATAEMPEEDDLAETVGIVESESEDDFTAEMPGEDEELDHTVEMNEEDDDDDASLSDHTAEFPG